MPVEKAKLPQLLPFRRQALSKECNKNNYILQSMLNHFSFLKGDQGKLDSLVRKLTFRRSFPDMRTHS